MTKSDSYINISDDKQIVKTCNMLLINTTISVIIAYLQNKHVFRPLTIEPFQKHSTSFYKIIMVVENKSELCYCIFMYIISKHT